MEDKVHQFNVLNQWEADVKEITCSTCDKFLTDEIYAYFYKDLTNYCKSCKPYKLLTSSTERNRTAEQWLKNLLFPCHYKDCDYILKANQVAEHSAECIYATNIDCALCDSKKLSLFAYKTHLETAHNDNIIKMDVPLMEISLGAKVKNEIYVGILNQHYFLIEIKRTKVALNVNVAKLRNTVESSLSKKFTVCCKINNANQTLEKTITKTFIKASYINTEYEWNDNKYDIHLDVGAQLNLEILLCNYKKNHNLVECSICFNTLGAKVYQCDNGHNVCLSCGVLINQCPICRSDNMNIINLRYLYTDLEILCDNFQNGCLMFEQSDVLKPHEAECLFGPSNVVQCIKCNEDCRKYNLTKHFKEKHALSKNIQDFRVVHQTKFISFKNQIFCYSCQVIASNKKEHHVKIGFAVNLLYCEDVCEAEKYRFEVHILDTSYKTLHVLKSICQTESDHSFSLKINYDTCVRQFADVDKLNHRIVIVEVEPSL